MPSTGMNIILSKGSAIKDVHNVRKQNLELTQQFVAQQTEDKKKKDKVKVQELETKNRIEIKNKKDKRNKEGKKRDKRGAGEKKSEEEISISEGRLIDIKV